MDDKCPICEGVILPYIPLARMDDDRLAHLSCAYKQVKAQNTALLEACKSARVNLVGMQNVAKLARLHLVTDTLQKTIDQIDATITLVEYGDLACL